MTTCEGCGKPTKYVAELPVGGTGRTASVCGKGVAWSSVVFEPLQACKRKAREKLRLCPGCDDEGVDPGELCDMCHRLIEIGRKARADDPLIGYGFRALRLIGEAFFDSARDDEVERGRLICLLARAVAGRGANAVANEQRAYESFTEVTKSQHEALDALVPALREALDAARRAGHRQGRSLLLGLATGGVTAEGFDSSNAKADAKGEAAEYGDD